MQVRRWSIRIGFILLAALAASPVPAAENAVEGRMSKDITFLASDQCEGRGVATVGNHLAGDYIAAQLWEAGVKPGGKDGSYFQPFTVRGNSLEVPPHLALTGPKGKEMALTRGVQCEPLGVGGTGKVVKAPIVFAGYGLTATRVAAGGGRETFYDDYDGLDVKGKVVVVLQAMPKPDVVRGSPYLGAARGSRAEGLLREKLANAEKHGAVGLLLVNDHVTAADGDELMVFSQSAVDVSPAKIPAFMITRAQLREMLPAEDKDPLAEREAAIDMSGKPQSASTKWLASMEMQVKHNIDCRNICGVVEGSGPLANETVVIGAHYDHWGFGGHGSLARMQNPTYGKPAIHHGADDNGSGSTTILEVARHFAAMPGRQGRRLVFLWFSGEELGLLGSVYYCNNPLYPLENTVAMINLDMVGRLRPDPETQKGRMIVFGQDTSKELATLLDDCNKKADLKLVKRPRGTSVWNGSDHASFNNKKVPVLFFYTDDHPQYHKPTDTVETLNLAGMVTVAKLTEDIVEQVAAKTEKPDFIPGPAGRGNFGGGVRIGFTPEDADGKEGFVIASVQDESPAAKAGLKKGDRVVEVAGTPVKTYDAFVPLLRNLRAGEAVDFVILRDGKRMVVKVTPEAGQRRGGAGFALGIRPGYSDDKEGVLVETVREGGPGEKAGIKDGDRIVAIDGKPVKNLEDYMDVLGNHPQGKPIDVTVLRAGKKVELKVEAQ